MKRKFAGTSLMLTALLVLVSGLAAPLTAQEAAKEVVYPQPSPNRFSQQRHEEIMASPGRKDCQIAFIGDSIMVGWAGEGLGKEIWDKEYAPLNAQNLGCVCDTTGNVLWRLAKGELDGMKKLKVIVLMIGTNDIGLARQSGENAAAGVKAVVAFLKKEAPQAKILLMGIGPKGRGQDRVEIANAIICKLDDGKQVFYQDITEAINKSGGRADRVGHLNAAGFQAWADEIRPTLAKLMK